MLLTLSVGDSSRDGHQVSSTYACEVNKEMTQNDISIHYKKASNKFGFDITEYCKEYEDNKIPIEYGEKLNNLIVSNGFKDIFMYKYNLENNIEEEYFEIEPNEFVNIYISIFNLLDESVQMRNIDSEIINKCIGGYGLFY